jgi:SAM-dependent methyltransferase
MNYKFAYAIGFHPWEDAQDQPEFNQSFNALLDDEESTLEAPYGRALDLGTGSGIWGIKLAERGWQVTGVDNVGKALVRGRERAQKAGIDMQFVRGDVTELREAAGVGADYRLVLDTGAFHGLTTAQCKAMGREVDAVTTKEATVLLLSWAPKRRGPFPRGVSQEEIEAAFPGWKVEDVGPTGFEAPKPIEALLKPDERWYRLHRE